MKTKIIVSELTHDDLTCLLSTALYGSYWAAAGYDKEVYKTLSETHGNCFEEKLADMLLAGHKISITDYEADGEGTVPQYARLDCGYEPQTPHPYDHRYALPWSRHLS